ncbi:MAG: cell division protein FtsZ [Flavobacteriales bacterium]|nr:cell division protein FtsZ [Bacteroidota bacterium]MCB9240990.1 cell division protein FtsZ [Flavobacteriales bacterium]
MNFKVDLPKERSSIIKVVGVGGGGGNAVNYMFREGISGVDFFICNTDNQALEMSPIPNKIQIGNELTEGRGAGSNPEVGRQSAEESMEEIIDSLGVNTQMVFVTAGMGGGTGTGAAPVIAKAAKDMGILTVGIVTTPFTFEGSKRGAAADHGIELMRQTVDSLLVISNDRIKDMYGNLPISQAFSHADNVLSTAAKGIAEIITIAGSINVDFEDVKTAMKNSGVAIMGNGVADGEGRALRAAEMALNSPLLNDNKITGASDLLINISYGDEEARMDEYSEINEFFQEQAGMEANLKCGLCYDETLGPKISVTIIATGFDRQENRLRSTESDHIIESVSLLDNDSKEEQADLAETKQASIFDYINVPEEKEILEADRRVEEMKQRLVHLRQLSKNAASQEGMEELENVPAYKRKGIKLESTAHSSESEISRVSLVEEPEKKPELKSNNSFLHDNVD